MWIERCCTLHPSVVIACLHHSALIHCYLITAIFCLKLSITICRLIFCSTRGARHACSNEMGDVLRHARGGTGLGDPKSFVVCVARRPGRGHCGTSQQGGPFGGGWVRQGDSGMGFLGPKRRIRGSAASQRAGCTRRRRAVGGAPESLGHGWHGRVEAWGGSGREY